MIRFLWMIKLKKVSFSSSDEMYKINTVYNVFIPVSVRVFTQHLSHTRIVSLLVYTAYSHVVENTAFFGDVALRFPRIVHHYYDRNAEWGKTLRWGLSFCNQSGVFNGGSNQQVLTLVCVWAF